MGRGSAGGGRYRAIGRRGVLPEGRRRRARGADARRISCPRYLQICRPFIKFVLKFVLRRNSQSSAYGFSEDRRLSAALVIKFAQREFAKFVVLCPICAKQLPS